ncbi:MAG: helix-turn-helix transcriptional regulator [Clostridia bacterium]|nr:helix-turn-helix transcriptional regulator [Clostridia bacterium]
MENIKDIIAKNLTSLRIEKKWTQNELADKLNYSDKSVSKWEHGETTPPIDVLKQLADLYDVSLDYLVTDVHDDSYDRVYNNKKNNLNKIIITSLAVSLVWLIATILYVYCAMLFNESYWILFITAVPFSSIVLLVFNGIWGKRIFTFYLVSILIWSILLSIYLLFLEHNPWIIFILGAPLQIAVILWAFLVPNKMLSKKQIKERKSL